MGSIPESEPDICRIRCLAWRRMELYYIWTHPRAYYFYEMKTAMIRNKIKNCIGNPLFATLSILRTYLLFAFSLIFFRLESVSDALYYIRNISFSTHASWKEVSIGIPDHNCIVAGSALVLILVYEYFMSKRDLLEALEKQPMLVRWGIYYLLAIMFFTWDSSIPTVLFICNFNLKTKIAE